MLANKRLVTAETVWHRSGLCSQNRCLLQLYASIIGLPTIEPIYALPTGYVIVRV